MCNKRDVVVELACKCCVDTCGRAKSAEKEVILKGDPLFSGQFVQSSQQFLETSLERKSRPRTCLHIRLKKPSKWALGSISPRSSRMARMNWNSQIEASTASFLFEIASMLTRRPTGSSKVHRP